MAKYMVLFTPESVDPNDDSFKSSTIFNTMLFGYPDDKSGWTFSSAADAHKEAKDNGYRRDIDYIVVRLLK